MNPQIRNSKIHFVGIGGIGMSGIAEVLANMGCQVTGSDLARNSQVERLEAMGVQIAKGHDSKNIPAECDVVVFSSAVKQDNPEIVESRRRHIPIIQRAEMLAQLMRLKRGIAIGGSHGKTTTTSMVAALMLANQMDPTIVVGGRLDLIKSTAALGKGEWLVAEADESDGSFLSLSPEIVVVTNIDNDHLDHFKTFDGLVKAFESFAGRIPFFGCAVLCVDDPHVRHLSDRFGKRQITYGFDASARLTAKNVKTKGTGQEYDAYLDNQKLGRIELQVPGLHNVLNSLACVGVGLELKLDFANIALGIKSYRGVESPVANAR